MVPSPLDVVVHFVARAGRMAPSGPYATRPSKTQFCAKTSFGPYAWGLRKPTSTSDPDCAARRG
jgi:hypothetical protein